MKTGGANNLIIDGNNLLYRIFWTSNYKIEESNNPGQVFLFLRSLKSYVDKFRPKNVYCTWDKKLEWPSTNFRREATTVEYKAGRDDEKFKNVFENAEKIQELLTNLGVHNIYPLRMEADDLMAWLSEELDGTSVIVTTDKDLLQTVTQDTIVYSPIKKKEISLDNFEEYTGVKKEYYISGDIPWLLSGEISKKEICCAENYITEAEKDVNVKAWEKNTGKDFKKTRGRANYLIHFTSTGNEGCS